MARLVCTKISKLSEGFQCKGIGSSKISFFYKSRTNAKKTTLYAEIKTERLEICLPIFSTARHHAQPAQLQIHRVTFLKDV